jgi:hypothetical protein
MAVKYVKDFAFDSGFGFSGSSGKTPVKSHMRSPMKKADGGAVKSKGFDNSTRNPISKFPDIAPAMVEKRSKGLGGLASETKKLDAYDRPHAEGKKGAKVAQYAKGGAVKKAHAKKEMPSFLKAKMMKKAEGGPVAEITAGDGMSPLQEMAYAAPKELMGRYSEEYDRPQLPPQAELEQSPPPLPPPELTPLKQYDMRPSGDRVDWFNLWTQKSKMSPERYDEYVQRMAPLSGMSEGDYRNYLSERSAANAAEIANRKVDVGPKPPAYGLLETLPTVPLAGDDGKKRLPAPIEPSGSGGGGSSDVGIGGLFGGMPAPSPLARAAMPTKADRMATRRDNMMAARDIMDRYIGGERSAMPRRSMAPGMRGMAESKARRAMPVAPRAPMIDRSAPQPYMPNLKSFSAEELAEYSKGKTFSPEGRYAKGGRVSKGEKKIGKVMGEFKRGELHSGSKKGPVVTNPKQATAIALSEARAAGAKIPKKKAMGGRACG